MIRLKDMLTEKYELGGAGINIIDNLTDKNNHTEARLVLARQLDNKKLIRAYEGIKAIQDILRRANEVSKARDALDKILFSQAKKTFDDYDIIMGAF